MLGAVERTKSAVVVERLRHYHEGDIMPNEIQEMNLEEYREEIDKILDEYGHRLGEVWSGLKEGLSDDEIAESVGLANSHNVYLYRTAIEIIRKERSVPDKPTSAERYARNIRGFLKDGKNQLSESASENLTQLLEECNHNASDEKAIDEQSREMEQETREQESSGRSGIYVYTLPHYYRHPKEPGSDDDLYDRTLFKVGMSELDAEKRVREQSTTALPEPPSLLRIYSPKENNDDIPKIEKKLHKILRAANHKQNREKGAGKEWFLTSLEFLDAVAEIMDLDVWRSKIEDR